MLLQLADVNRGSADSDDFRGLSFVGGSGNLWAGSFFVGKTCLRKTMGYLPTPVPSIKESVVAPLHREGLWLHKELTQ